jgi:hypothetical protein
MLPCVHGVFDRAGPRAVESIAKLGKMKLNDLQAKFAEVVGETTRSPNKTIRRISEVLKAADAWNR